MGIQGIILAAGMGSRLKKLTQKKPKCMVEVSGVTLIERALKQLDIVAPLVFVPCYREQGIAPEYFDIDMSVAVENMLLQKMRLAWMLCGWALRRIKREWMRCVKC